MSNAKTLEDAVAKTAAAVTDWRTKIAQIDARIATENHAITIAKQHCEQHALASTLNEPHAVAAIRKAQSELFDSEQHLAVLSIALPKAILELAAAERAAATGRHDLAMLRAESKKRARIAAAGRLDEALSACAAAFAEYERLGHELQSDPDLNMAQGGGMARWEDAAGLKRISAALPACLKTLPSWTWTHPSKHVRLADAEAAFWSLPPPVATTKAA
jgi:cob(I)alamin adenosyltransferase